MKSGWENGREMCGYAGRGMSNRKTGTKSMGISFGTFYLRGIVMPDPLYCASFHCTCSTILSSGIRLVVYGTYGSRPHIASLPTGLSSLIISLYASAISVTAYNRHAIVM